MNYDDLPSPSDRGVLIYSGGMDSTTLLYESLPSIALCLSFNYGSKHNARELLYAKRNCALLNIPHKVVELPFIAELFRSDLLLSGGPVPDGEYSRESLKSTVVPFRNGIMLSIAAGVAESHELSFAIFANHGGDHEIYPDCRPAFVSQMNAAIREGSGGKVKLLAPYTQLDKRAIALRGKTLGVDFSQSWSCYKGLEIHCGVCSTCKERRKALEGFDPTRYSE